MKQHTVFGTVVTVEDTAVTKPTWSVYAVPRYYDGVPVTSTISAYSAKQAKYLFEKYNTSYRVVDIYRI